MIQVVILSDSTTSASSVREGVRQVTGSVEQKVNEWLKSHPDIELLNIVTAPQLAGNFWGSGFAMTATIAFKAPCTVAAGSET